MSPVQFQKQGFRKAPHSLPVLMTSLAAICSECCL
jgi:hypothetical protein